MTTRTVATLEISKAAYDEIAAKLRAAGYDHAFRDGIDMHGIALECAPPTSAAQFPEIEMWSDNVLDDAALVEMIEASNAYALAEFNDPINEIYEALWRSVGGFIPQLLIRAVKVRVHAASH